MKKNIISLVAVCLLGALFTVMAGEVKTIKIPYWQDIQTVSVNREEPRTAFMTYDSRQSALSGEYENSKYYKLLNGTWKFYYSDSHRSLPGDAVQAVADMNVGDIIDVHLMPEEAYGEKDPDAIITVPISELAGSEELKVDDMVYLQNVYGQPFPAKVTALTDNDITFDANHEMAGKELNFKIELVEVK